MVILVDSREISGAQDIVSSLRLNHSALVYTRQLSACDYILSNRMAVERFNMSSKLFVLIVGSFGFGSF